MRKRSVLDTLKPEEARAVLGRLLAAHPALRAEAEQVARSVPGGVSFEAVADQVEEAVRALDLDDLQCRSGRHAWGYVEPTEAAWEILEDVEEPFPEDRHSISNVVAASRVRASMIATRARIASWEAALGGDGSHEIERTKANAPMLNW